MSYNLESPEASTPPDYFDVVLEGKRSRHLARPLKAASALLLLMAVGAVRPYKQNTVDTRSNDQSGSYVSKQTKSIPVIPSMRALGTEYYHRAVDTVDNDNRSSTTTSVATKANSATVKPVATTTTTLPSHSQSSTTANADKATTLNQQCAYDIAYYLAHAESGFTPICPGNGVGGGDDYTCYDIVPWPADGFCPAPFEDRNAPSGWWGVTYINNPWCVNPGIDNEIANSHTVIEVFKHELTIKQGEARVDPYGENCS